MKPLGIFLLLIGAIWGIVAFNFDTTVETEGRYIGDLHIPSQRVHNIGKMDQRRNHLLLAGLLAVVGVVLFGFGSTRSSTPTPSSAGSRKCPFCAEMVKSEATICRFCQKELPPLPSAPSEAERTGTKPCPHCNATLPAASDYCMQCNRSL